MNPYLPGPLRLTAGDRAAWRIYEAKSRAAAEQFIRPGGQVAPIRWLNILAGKGAECSAAVARVAALDHHANGGWFRNGRSA